MAFVRSIGRWGLTALVINCIIGSGIFGVPAVLIGILGRASPIAMVIAGLAMGSIMLCYAEVASQFTQPGGSYLYTRAAFGNFAGLQVGWFWWLSTLGGAAANANLFVIYLGGLLPWAAHGFGRALIITGIIAAPTVANYVGVRSGANLSSALTVAKLVPLAGLIVLGLAHFSRHFEVITTAEVAAPSLLAWFDALLLLVFTFGGFEDAMVPMGEVKDPRRSVPMALCLAMASCVAVYTLLQFVVVASIGASRTQEPLAATAAVLIGRGGAVFIEGAAMISTYGWISASLLNAPRLVYSLAAQGEFPAPLGRLHPRFNTPHVALLLFAGLAWLLSVTGTFQWTLALSAGSMMTYYATVSGALVRLRRTQPNVPAFRVPFGPVFSVIGIMISLVLLSRLEGKQALLMCVTAAIATANWLWARRRAAREARAIAAAGRSSD